MVTCRPGFPLFKTIPDAGSAFIWGKKNYDSMRESNYPKGSKNEINVIRPGGKVFTTTKHKDKSKNDVIAAY